MKNDAALNEVVEVNGSISNTVEFAEKHVMGSVVETVTERGQRCFEFLSVDVSRVVPVEAAEAALPVRHVFPEGAEILERYGASILTVKHTWHGQSLLTHLIILSPKRKENHRIMSPHTNHHSTCFRIEGGPCAVG